MRAVTLEGPEIPCPFSPSSRPSIYDPPIVGNVVLPLTLLPKESRSLKLEHMEFQTQTVPLGAPGSGVSRYLRHSVEEELSVEEEPPWALLSILDALRKFLQGLWEEPPPAPP